MREFGGIEKLFWTPKSLQKEVIVITVLRINRENENS